MNERMRQLGGKLELASNEGCTIVTAMVPADKTSTSRPSQEKLV